MPIYECKLCDYHTKNTTDLVRHKKTDKHKLREALYNADQNNKHKIDITVSNKSEKSNKESCDKDLDLSEQTNDNVTDDKLDGKSECSFCHKKFNTKSSMYRHKRLFCKLKKKISLYHLFAYTSYYI